MHVLWLIAWQLYFSCHCRHAGDLGNIEADSEGQAEVTITDYVVSLMGEYSVIGRTLEVCKHHWFLAKWEVKARTKVRLFWRNLRDTWNAHGLLLAIHAHSTYSMYIREKITSTSDRRPQSVTNPWVNKTVTNLAQFFFKYYYLCSIIIHELFKFVIEDRSSSKVLWFAIKHITS